MTNSERLSPKEFLKNRRPEQFSDSPKEAAPRIDRSILEYHLDTLTSRSQESDFENFARCLCEFEICPNLLPQTGPKGGGDSKVDSETLPVADDLALLWFTGNAREAARERWAFAFSAKKKWRDKVRSDVAKLKGTGRQYTKAFFVTNQYVSDRSRAELEDELTTEHALDVRILDRTWILDRVFSCDRQELAIQHLGVTAIETSPAPLGPQDVQRAADLDEAENRLEVAVQEGAFGPALVENAIEAARLARELERPAAELEGRFSRADSLAMKYGTFRQKVEAAYQWAWTLFWWLEDYGRFNAQYEVVQSRASGSPNVYDLERLSNVWHLLRTACLQGALDPATAHFDSRTTMLREELKRLLDDKERPSAALQSEALLSHVETIRALDHGDSIERALLETRRLAERAEKLPGFPFGSFAEILTELGNVPTVGQSSAYAELNETIVAIVARRTGEVAGAQLLVRRGQQQLEHGFYADAVATLGRALTDLYKHESRLDAVRALYFCACAYDELGLPWAARGSLVNAASIATNDLWHYGDVTPYQVAVYRRIKWIELQLGRVAPILAWHELDLLMRSELERRGWTSSSTSEFEGRFQFLLARLLLRTEFGDLAALQKLPSALERLGLPVPAAAVRYALGHEGALKELSAEQGISEREFAEQWRGSEAAPGLAEYPEMACRSKLSMRSNVLGCSVEASVQNERTCVLVAESVLAALEGFLATGTLHDAIAREPLITLDVARGDFAKDPFTARLEESSGRPHVVVRCASFEPHAGDRNRRALLQESILELATRILAHAILFRDPEQDLTKLLRGERVLDRSISFTGSFVSVANVLGEEEKSLDSWSDPKDPICEVLRKKPWELPKHQDGNEPEEARPAEDAEPPAGLFDSRRITHRDMTTQSLIREPLWNRAGWSGVVFLTGPGTLPSMGFLFRDGDAACTIFEQWHQELGQDDPKDLLRLAIIRGVSRSEPAAYSLTIGTDVRRMPQGKKVVAMLSRIHRMHPQSSVNLDRFLESYREHGSYQLLPALHEGELSTVENVKFGWPAAMRLRRLDVRDAWRIDVNDPDISVLRDDDEPIIPPAVSDPPVARVLARRRTRRCD